MKLKAFHITNKRCIRLSTEVHTLDELTRALPQGFYTTFSTIVRGTRVMGLKKHLQRLYEPAKHINLNASVDEEHLREQIFSLAKENLPAESRIRLILAKKSGDVYIGIQPFTPLPESVYDDGVNVITMSGARHDPRIKDTGFISESAAQRQLLNREVFEVLLTQRGSILEGMTSNFYAIKNRTLVTARRGILLGVTRRAVLGIARGEGMNIEYCAPRADELFDEAFLTSSSRGIVPIVSIDKKIVGEGKVGRWTKILMKEYHVYLDKKGESIFPRLDLSI